ncbi:MAG: type II toxin-antitoxin system RelE/ParE family toxin [Bryobacteraceae bacterium]
MKRLPLRWAQAASLDLIEIIEFIKRDRPDAARKLGHSFLTEASRLRRNPRQGKVVPELLEKGIADYRQLLISAYRLIYVIRSEFIDIVAVIDSRRDVQALIFQRFIR